MGRKWTEELARALTIVVLIALAGPVGPRDRVSAQDGEGRLLTILAALCPEGYVGNASADECDDSPISGVPFQIAIPFTEAITDPVLTDEEGLVSLPFEGMPMDGTLRVIESLPPGTERFVVYCVDDMGTELAVTYDSTSNPGLGVADIAVGDANAVFCDWYHVPTLRSSTTPEARESEGDLDPHGTEVTPASSGTASAPPPPTATPTPGLPSACTSPAYPTPALDPSLNLPGYLAVFYDGAFFVEWTEMGGTLSGTLYWTGPDEQSPDGLGSMTAGFTGILDGNQMALTIPQGLGFTTTVSGLLEGDSLSLFFTDDNGNPTPAVLHRGTLAEYDQAVRSLRQETAQGTACAQAVEATATAIAAQQNAVDDANAALDYAINRLNDDVAQLAEDTDFTGVIDAYATDWTDMQDDDEAMRAEAEVVPFDCYQLTSVEFALTELEYDVTEFEFDDTNLEYAVDTVNSDIAAVEQDIVDVRAAFDMLQAAVAANTTGEPEAWFTQDDVDRAVNSAQEQIDVSNETIETAQAQAQDYDEKAAELLEQGRDFVAGLTCPG